MFAVHLDVWWCLWHCRLGGQWSTLFKAVNHMFYSRWWFQEDSSACICRSIAATRREELSNLLSQKAWDQRCFQTDLYGVAPVAVLEVLGQQLRPNCTCKNVRFTAVHQSSVFFFWWVNLEERLPQKASQLQLPAPGCRSEDGSPAPWAAHWRLLLWECPILRPCDTPPALRQRAWGQPWIRALNGMSYCTENRESFVTNLHHQSHWLGRLFGDSAEQHHMCIAWLQAYRIL
jgi:hypothetical protein